MHEPSVALILPAHRAGRDLRRCLASIGALQPRPDEVVAVIDGGDPDAARLARSVADRVIRSEARSGPAGARNRGADASSAQILLFLDSDVELRSDAVGIVRTYFRDHPGVAAVIGSYDADPGSGGLIGRYKNLLNHYTHQHAKLEGSTFWGALGAIRRDAFLKVGGFDEAYASPQIEDIELGYRLRAAGYRIHVLKHLQGKHLKQWTPRLLLKSDVLDRALPWSELILASGFRDDLNISRVQRLKVAVAMGSAISLAAAPWSRAARRGLLSGIVALIALDAPLLRYFAQRGGGRFAAVAAGWHWFSYLYSAFAFGVATVRHIRDGGRAPRRSGDQR